MSIEQIVILALIQGITEFLPVSSSGHLILIPALTGWSDQGHVTDVMVHVGSLMAVIVYFWRDVVALIGGGFDLLRGRWSLQGQLALFIILGTIPAVLFGLILKTTGLLGELRGVEVVAWNAIIYGVVLYLADRFGPQLKTMEDMRFMPAMIIGVAQALALIPGTSRSGATISAARALGFKREEAARFSFLLGIPAILAAGLLTGFEVVQSGEAIENDTFLAAFLTFLSALAAIAFLMALIKRMGFLPFVLYRFALAAFLFAGLYGWIPGLNL